MNLQSRLLQFRSDNPFDSATQAKRLLASEDKELILYVLELGLETAKHRQRHAERDYIKNVGSAPPKERLIPGRVTGSVVIEKVPPSAQLRNATQALIGDVWMVGSKKLNDCGRNDLSVAMIREEAAIKGATKNFNLYGGLKKCLKNDEVVGAKIPDRDLRSKIEEVYGEFRTSPEAGH